MPAEQVNYRLALEVGDGQAVSEPGPLDQVLEAFNRQITTGAFRPGSGRRLLVLSNEAWSVRRGLRAGGQELPGAN
jgi:hypothetical protein